MTPFRLHPGDFIVFDGERWDPELLLENGIALRPHAGGNSRPFTWTDMTRFWSDRRLTITRAGMAGLPAKLVVDMRKDISVFSEHQQAVARYRMKFIRALEFALSLREVGRRSLFRPARIKPKSKIILTAASLDRLCERVAKQIRNKPKDDMPCSGAALLDWYARYRKSGRCYCALVPQYHHQGRWGTRHHKIAVEVMNEYAAFYFLQPERPAVASLFAIVSDAIRNKLREAGVDKDLREAGNLDPDAIETLVPDIKSFYRLIDKVRRRDLITYRDDAQTADRTLRLKQAGRRYTRPGEAIQIDTTELPVVLCDPEQSIAYKHVQFTLAVDLATRAPLGFYVGLERGWATIQETLRMTMLPKDWVATMHDIVNPWPCTLRPELVFTDQGADYRSESLVTATSQLAIRLMHTPAGHPDLKGAVERLFRTAKQAIFDGIPGRLFKDGGRRVDYDPSGNAILTMDQAIWVVTKFLVDYYMIDWHEGIGGSPLDRWNKLVDRKRVEWVDDVDQLISLISTRCRRTVQHTGVEWEGLHYGAGSEELQELLWERKLKGVKFDIGIDALDVGRAYLLEPGSGRWITLQCNDPDAHGRTKHEHKLIRAGRNADKRAHKRKHRAALDATKRALKLGTEEVFRSRLAKRVAAQEARRTVKVRDPMAAQKTEAMDLGPMPSLTDGPNAVAPRPTSRRQQLRPRLPPVPVPGPSRTGPIPTVPAIGGAPTAPTTAAEIRVARRRAPMLPKTALPSSGESPQVARKASYVRFY